MNIFEYNMPEIENFCVTMGYKGKSVTIKYGVRLEEHDVFVVEIPQQHKDHFFLNMEKYLYEEEKRKIEKILCEIVLAEPARLYYEEYKLLIDKINCLKEFLNNTKTMFGFHMGNK